MDSIPEAQRRRSIRLKGYDYSRAGAYFVTTVTQNRLCLFGDVVGDEMHLNEAGIMTQEMLETLPRRFPGIDLDAFVIMPNHIHGIIVINEPVGASLVGAQDNSMATGERAATMVAPTLGEVMGAYKSLTTIEYARGVTTCGWKSFYRRLWQRNYYERVIRDGRELDRAREYIANNPMQWALDSENPDVALNAAPAVDFP